MITHFTFSLLFLVALLLLVGSQCHRRLDEATHNRSTAYSNSDYGLHQLRDLLPLRGRSSGQHLEHST